MAVGGQEQIRKTPLDSANTQGKVCVIGRQSHQDVEVIGQKNDRVKHESVQNLHVMKCLTQKFPDAWGGQERSPFVCDDGEEKRSTIDITSPVSHMDL